MAEKPQFCSVENEGFVSGRVLVFRLQAWEAWWVFESRHDTIQPTTFVQNQASVIGRHENPQPMTKKQIIMITPNGSRRACL